MENASKALLIAGGILIALLIIALLVYSFGSMSGYFSSEETKEEAEQLEAFNKQYEAYQRKLLRGTDIISVINKISDNNEKYGPNGYNEPNYIINVEFEMKEAMVYKKVRNENGKQEIVGTEDATFEVGKRYNLTTFSSIRNNSDAFTDFKRRVFDCVDIGYNKTTGRVNYMRFEERKINYGEGL